MSLPERIRSAPFSVDRVTGEVLPLDTPVSRPSGGRKIHWEREVYDVEESWGEQSPYVSHPAEATREGWMVGVALAAGALSGILAWSLTPPWFSSLAALGLGAVVGVAVAWWLYDQVRP